MIAKYDSGGIFVRQPNDAQRRVIDDLDNNIILFASAGTGKTFTVAKRVAQIIQSGRAKPSELLCLTFTVKACEEMREDIAQYVGQSASEVEIRTIHSFTVEQQGDEVVFTVTGNGFLQHQVRIMVGTLLEVGTLQRQPDSITQLFGGKRSDAGPAIPSSGLCLMEVSY